MQLEAEEPAHRVLAALGNPSEGPMVVDGAIVTHRQRRGINEADAGAFPIAALQVGT